MLDTFFFLLCFDSLIDILCLYFDNLSFFHLLLMITQLILVFKIGDNSRSDFEIILYLLLMFLCMGITCLLFNLSFAGIAYILIYAGAVVVLFLFAVMIIGVKLNNTLSSNFYKLLTGLGYSLIGLSLFVYGLVLSENLGSRLDRQLSYSNFFYLSDNISEIRSIGISFYNTYAFLVVLSGLILLLGLVCIISFMINHDKSAVKIKAESQEMFKSLSRKDNIVTFLPKRFKKSFKHR